MTNRQFPKIGSIGISDKVNGRNRTRRLSEVTGWQSCSAGDVGQRVSRGPMANLTYNSTPGYVHASWWLRLLPVRGKVMVHLEPRC